MDAAFITDLCLTFRTAFEVEGPDGGLRMVTTYSRIAVRYLRGYFFLDVLSTVPWDVVMTNEALGLVQLLKVSKMIKLVRVI